MNGHLKGKRSSVPAFQPRHPRQAYIRHVQACKDALYAGESYELCLTNALSRSMAPNPLQLYYALRRRSPAPYAAFLSFGVSGPHVSMLLPQLRVIGCEVQALQDQQCCLSRTADCGCILIT